MGRYVPFSRFRSNSKGSFLRKQLPILGTLAFFISALNTWFIVQDRVDRQKKPQFKVMFARQELKQIAIGQRLIKTFNIENIGDKMATDLVVVILLSGFEKPVDIRIHPPVDHTPFFDPLYVRVKVPRLHRKASVSIDFIFLARTEIVEPGKPDNSYTTADVTIECNEGIRKNCSSHWPQGHPFGFDAILVSGQGQG
jgi:hypothetical protein